MRGFTTFLSIRSSERVDRILASPSAALGRPGARGALVALAGRFAVGVSLAACSSGAGQASSDAGAKHASTADAALVDAAMDAAPSADGPIADAGPPTAAGDGCEPDGAIPEDLRCTGLYSDWTSRTIAPGVMPYTPGLVFWSDGADKTRWIYLPPGAQIDTTDMDNWVFPNGTKVWKQFVVGGQLVETRMLWKGGDGTWQYLDYRWSDDAGAATRFDVGATQVNGTSYEIPATSVCQQCHNGSPDTLLGVSFVGLTTGATGVTVESLEQSKSFTANPPATTLSIPEDSTGKAAAALGWLHVNCGIACHNNNQGAGAARVGFFMKLLTSQLYLPDGGLAPVTGLDPYLSGVGVMGRAKPGDAGYDRIDPGQPDASLVSIFAGTRCPPDAGSCIQMPPIVTHEVDDAGLAEVNAWIHAL